jgi:small subunit ribosomal protein S8
MMTDPVADMLTRIRNGNRIERPAVEMPNSAIKEAVAQVLKDEGFILDYHVGHYVNDEQGHPAFQEGKPEKCAKPVLRVYLKYGPEGERVIRHLRRASTPGRRLYRGHKELPPVLNGLGIAVVSTSKGVMSDRRARAERVGGEVICTVW